MAKEDRAEYDKIVSYTPGFNEMSEISHENEKLYLWEVIYEHWATSDKIRDELTALGFAIKDTKDGCEWKLNK